MFWLPIWIGALLASAALASPLVRALPRLGPLLLALVPGAAAVWFVTQMPAVAVEPLLWQHAWVPALGVEVALRLDALGLAFALLVCGIGAPVVVFAGGYLRGKPTAAPTIAGLLAFAGAMLGLVLADDALFMFVCWEATTLISYLLVGLEHQKSEARAAAKRALLITAAGGLGLLGALVGLEVITGAGSLSTTPAVSEAAGTWIALGVLLAAFTKSAQVPFHIWLPGAMAAPTPVSAYLHSATMVKAGVYLVLRMAPTLGEVPLWRPSLLIVGGITALLGGLLAMAATDLKRILACTTVAALGAMLLVAGIDHPLAIGAALGLALAHGLYKAGLFMVAGAVEKVAGTRDLRQMPQTDDGPPRLLTAVAALAGLSMAAAPPMLGFAAKETALTVALAAGGVAAVFAAFALTASGAAFVYAALAVAREPRGGGAKWLSPMVIGPPLLLAVAGLVAGPGSAALGVALLDPVAGAAVGLAIWHGVGLPLGLSALALALGVLLWRRRAVFRGAAEQIDRLADTAGHDRLWDVIVAFARTVARAVQPVALRANLSVILLAAVGLVLFALLRMRPPALVAGPNPDIIDAVLAAFLLGGALGAARARSRLTAIGAMGAVGVGAALFYLRHGAPDLAMTQLLVEVLTVVLLMLAFRRLPEFGPRRTGFSRRWSAAVALAAGGIVGGLVYLAGAVELGPGISSWFSTQALPEGYGRNVVNVILVDFRALDTLGEVAVLAVAALGAGALLARRREVGS